MATVFNPVGLYRMNIMTLNTNGYPTGTAGASPANGSTNNALYETRVRGTGWSQAGGTTVTFEGGDVPYNQFTFGGSQMQPFELELHHHNKTLQALIQGTSIDTTNPYYPTTGNNPQKANPPNVAIILTSQAKSLDAATSGLTKYEHFVFPACTCEWLYGSPSYQAAHVSRIRVTPSVVSKDLLGTAFDSSQGFANNSTDMYDFTTDYPIHITTFVSDAAAVVSTALYLPISSTITINASPNVYAKNGTVTALTSANVSTGVLTFPAAGTAGDMMVVMYQHNEVLSA